jgi:uncharacterized hydrophobic protein (TIGR00271 family)
MISLSEILKDNKFTPSDIPELEHKLFFEGDKTQRYLVQFTILLFLSAVIATAGVIGDSTATVVGAMIIAPLMTPMLATTAAMMMGNALRAWRALLIVVAGALGVIIVSAVLGMLAIDDGIDFKSNAQITARVAPRVLDLIIALAAGTAGAFAISRNDISDSIPGVAISIALVPPLCVVGITLSAGQLINAWGALLLFLTNFLSILLAGGAVFTLLGLGAAFTREMRYIHKRRAYRIVVLGVALIAIPLTVTTTKIARDSIAQVKITNITSEWIRQSPASFVIKSVLVSGNTAKILISGAEEPASIKELGLEIETKVEQIKTVDLSYVRSNNYRYP